MSSQLDALTKSLVDVYTTKLNEQQKKDLIQCLEVLADNEKYNKFSNIFPDEGALGIKNYKKHISFFNAGSKYRERFFLACNRGGKSEAGAFEVVCHATGLYRDWWKGKKFSMPTMIWIGGDTATTCRDIIQKKLLGDIGDIGSGMIPKDLIVDTKPRRGTPDGIETIRVKHITGGISTIVLKTYEQGRETWQGSEIDFCIAQDSPVLMADGTYRKIQDVTVGEYVMSVDKSKNIIPRKVCAVYDRGEKEVIDVSTKNGIWIEATPDHKVFNSVKNKVELQDAKRLLQADLTQLNSLDVKTKYHHTLYKLLGLYLAEGTYKSRKVTIGNSALMEGLIKDLPDNARIRKYDFKEKHNHVPDWIIYWDEFWSLIPQGVSATKEIPDFVFTSSLEDIKNVIRYMYAGDGWASGKVIGYASTSRKLVEQLSLLLSRFGIRGSINKKKKQNNKWLDQWWLLIGASDEVISFCEEIGIPYKDDAIAKVLQEANRRKDSKQSRGKHFAKDDVIYSREKLKNKNIFQKRGYVTVSGTESKHVSHVYDLSVEGEHNFIVGSHVVSNCWLDEEASQSVYGEALIRLMTTNGSIITTFTPLSGLTDLVVSALDNSQETDSKFPKHVTTLSWDEVPHITAEMKEQMLAATPPALRDARSKGIPTVGSGLIYPLDQKAYTVDDFKVPVFWPKLYGFDVGWNSTAASFGAWDRDNDVIYVYSEYKRGGEEGEDMPLVHSSAIKARGSWMKGVIDPASRGRSQKDGEQLYAIYRKHGLKISPADNAVESGIYAVWERLNSGRLKVFKSCSGLIREMSLYHRNEKGAIVKTNDHLLDGLRYMLMAPAHLWSLPTSEADNRSKVVSMQNYMSAHG